MSLLLIGLSHKTAAIDERERLALADGALPGALQALSAHPGVAEGLILSTCNRVEVLAVSGAQPPDLLRFLSIWNGRDLTPIRSLFYHHRDEAVARHLFRVASSLDSQVIGEPQILGQLKQAYAAAHEAGTCGPQLELLLTRAFHAAKRVRTETEIATQPVSVSHMAVDLARQVFGDLTHKTVLLVGAGAMGELAARYLLQQGTSRLLVTNRTFARAQALAAKFQGTPFPLSELTARGDQADVVISCTGAPEPFIACAMVSTWLARRRQHPMLFLDMAVPRDVEPAVHQLDNAFVYNVDDLEKVAVSNLAERQLQAARAESILDSEVRRYWQRSQERDVVPILRALQEHAESLRRLEWERLRRRLGPLSPEQEQAVEALTKGLVQKLLHRPLVELKSARDGAGRAAMIELTQRLFALDPMPGGEAVEGGLVEKEDSGDGENDSVRDGASG